MTRADRTYRCVSSVSWGRPQGPFRSVRNFAAKDNFIVLTARVPGGDLLFPWQKRRQNAPEVRSGWTLRVHIRSPRTPVYGGYPLKQANPFRRAKSGVLRCAPIRPHWGPEWEENWNCRGSTPAPGFAEPTSRCEFWRAHAMRPYWLPVDCRGGYQPPASLPPQKSLPLGGRCPRRGRMRGQASNLVRFLQGDFAACGRRVTFSAMRKSPKTRRGTRPMDYGSARAPPGSIGPLTPDLCYGGYPLTWEKHSRRAKSGVLGCSSVRPHRGPEREEDWDWCGFASAPGFTESTSPVCFPP